MIKFKDNIFENISKEVSKDTGNNIVVLSNFYHYLSRIMDRKLYEKTKNHYVYKYEVDNLIEETKYLLNFIEYYQNRYGEFNMEKDEIKGLIIGDWIPQLIDDYVYILENMSIKYKLKINEGSMNLIEFVRIKEKVA